MNSPERQLKQLTCLYPLDVVKTRFQLQQKVSGARENSGVFSTLTKIVREEGFSRLYRGMGPLFLLEAPKRAVKFGSNDYWGKVIMKLFNTKEKTQTISLLTGCAAGATESLVVVPFELVKIRLQDKSKAHLYKGPMDVVRATIAQSGWTGLYRGLGSTMSRHILWNGGYFATIFKVQHMLPKAVDSNDRLRNSLFSGMAGGFVGTVLNTPVDVVKTRIRPRALYKGFVPKVLRLAPGGGILLLVVDARRILGPPYC
ncbi:hypothetical protein MVES_003068 [Malassezia vespertilionis]|uniref:Uncharacterized protein n=1 Tax=Malassezia vespertilionis TaxID=2020962 RepID=A0A2N1J9L4_9BASI|nr:hypothetical protein MVES_003068 [Malassezia vespertilionis]